MCRNSTRKITWEDPAKLNLEPIFLPDSRIADLDEEISIVLRVVHITTAEDYQIFDAIKSGNMSLTLDLIDAHKGINAVDEWGQTALMIAVSSQNIEIIASLLNTRMPKVDVNLAKSVSLRYCYQSQYIAVSYFRHCCLYSLALLRFSTPWRKPLMGSSRRCSGKGRIPMWRFCRR